MYKPFTRIVVSSEDEKKIIERRFPNIKVIVTGVGPLNVYQSLKHIPRWFKIINFGYAGGNKLEIGVDYEIIEVEHYHPHVDFMEPKYILEYEISAFTKYAACFTNNDFVLADKDSLKEYPCVYDMELAYICAMGFKHVRAIKRVSDNLDLDQYYETTTY
jgi:hypothetical protein